ncbi:MAG TPA: efflux RND transporter periplasmic adaptor subunit, partial [Burkholderiales bacterium]|nr:efflux RND transporter periplasmic adaptor subunit [Burkholderiales bacterium]
MSGRPRPATPGSFTLAAIVLLLSACSGKTGPQAPPPPEVGVIKAVTQPITVYEEYVGQTEAVDTVEVRARVSGLLQRQAFEDGARVKKGDVLFVIDQQPYLAALAQVKAALAQTQAARLNSKQSLDRIRPLLADKAISQQDLDAAIAKEGSDTANVDAAKAQVRTAELNLEYTTLHAPRDGVVSKALIKPGGLVNASTTLLTTLYSVDPIYVNFAVSEQKLLELQRQLKRNPGEEKAKLPAFRLKLADGSEYKLSGKLNFVDAAVDPKSGTLQVRVLVPNPDRLLRAGQLVRVVFPSLQELSAIRIPQKAVQELQGKRSVYVVDAEGKAAYREITANTRLGNDWVVESGVQPGEMVIVEGTQKVHPGAPVKPVAAAADATGD